MQKELQNLDRIYKPERPFVAVVAGAKFDTKIDSLNALLKVADQLVLGGLFTMLTSALNTVLKLKV